MVIMVICVSSLTLVLLCCSRVVETHITFRVNKSSAFAPTVSGQSGPNLALYRYLNEGRTLMVHEYCVQELALHSETCK